MESSWSSLFQHSGVSACLTTIDTHRGRKVYNGSLRNQNIFVVEAVGKINIVQVTFYSMCIQRNCVLPRTRNKAGYS